MNAANATTSRAMLVQIDRLAAGDLSESERRNLLVWLDEDPHRWRFCAIAFLEAQSWESAAAGLFGQASASPPRSVSEGDACPALPHALSAAVPPPPSKSRSARIHRALAIAASLALAFATGILLDHRLSRLAVEIAPSVAKRMDVPANKPQSPTEPLLATVAVRTNLGPDLPIQLQLPVTPVSAPAAAESSLSEYERQRWQRQGFELEEERRYLPARLPDGRQILVPVNKVNVKLKGTPTS
jgi:hypothetical protein